ncbi:hypothetical protein E8E11_006863 [Didymella keratinophila]|nr:hypothetical protein E8E11_006863 [Didymella keratinophila]
MHIDITKHLPPKLASALSKAKAKAKEKMSRASSGKNSTQSNHSDDVLDDSNSMSQTSKDQTYSEQASEMSELFTAEDKDDLEQMLKNDFATFSAEEYQAEIQPLFEDLLTFMNRQDALDHLG